MKIYSILLPALVIAAPLQAASTLNSDTVAALAFWSFQTEASNTAYQSSISRQKGFSGTPSLVFTGTALQSASGTNNGAQFTFDDHNYAGGGETRAIAWQHTATSAWVNDKSFTLTLNTTGFSDLNIRFDARTAANPSPHGQAPSSYTVLYSIDGGSSWIPTTLPATWAADASYHEVALDLSSITDLNNQSDVRIRFNLDDGPASAPDVSTTRNVRVDNFLVTAVPEPSAFILSALTALGATLRRRRA